MSGEVIREATILIRYKAEKGTLAGPDVQQFAKAQEEVAKAADAQRERTVK